MKNGEIAYLAFTEKGRALAETLRAVLGGEVSCTRDGVSLQDWTARAFPDARALVFIGAAAALGAEFTLPGVSQSLIVTRLAGRTPVPEKEALRSLARHGASMALFLSASMPDAVQTELLAGGFAPDTPAALVYKATWPDERVVRCTVGTLAAAGAEAGIAKTALILVGSFLDAPFEKSRLYDPSFTTGFREGKT